MRKIRIAGERILVKRELTQPTILNPEGVFKNIVEILALGEDLENTKFKVGEKVLLADGAFYEASNGEVYISESQILRWE